MVAFEGALERRSSGSARRAANVVLLDGMISGAVIYQGVGVVLVLLAAPDPPDGISDTSQNDGPTDADDNADNNLLGLWVHAGIIVTGTAALLETGSRRRGRFASEGGGLALVVRLRDDMGYGRDGGLARRAGLGGGGIGGIGSGLGWLIISGGAGWGVGCRRRLVARRSDRVRLGRSRTTCGVVGRGGASRV